jgi:hypothetical protein
MMGKEGVLSTFRGASSGSDIAVIEGVMGLFDSVESTSDAGSTVEIAKWLGAPAQLQFAFDAVRFEIERRIISLAVTQTPYSNLHADTHASRRVRPPSSARPL